MGRRNIDPEVKESYLNWLLTPPGEREPASKQEFANVHGVSYRVLYYWEDEEDFQAALRTIKGRWGVRWHGEILGKLMEIVQTRNDSVAVTAANTLLKHLDLSDSGGKSDELTSDQQKVVAELLEAAGYKRVNRGPESE